MEKEDNKSEKEGFFSGADKENNSSSNHVSVEIPASETSADSRRRVLHRVPPQVRERKMHIYDPVVLSIGPYHHGQPQFEKVETLKGEVLGMMLGSKDKGSILSRIRERVDQIRDFYGGLSRHAYHDDVLAEMMIRDGCFVLYYMEICSGDEEKDNHSVRRLGLSGVAFMYRDVFMLENQIPLWLIKFLFTLINDEEDQWEALLYKFLSEMNFGDDRLSKIPWDDKKREPLHILEAHRATLTNIGTIKPTANVHHHRRIFRFQWGRKKAASQSSVFETVNSQFRSVTYLKAKGIHFGPSSNCLTDIRFNSYLFYGKLQLPIWFVTNNSKVFFSNLIAFEMSPETDNDFAVISYINFMKSLIDEPKDVKELREKDILFSCLANDEEVFRMFKEMDTYGMDNIGIFQDVKKRIDEHCDSRGKTWMAELIHTYFRSPWTAIALFAATVLLCITFLQTFYTMHPPKKGN
ncbi:hypothetical protein DH2020_043445 [Rehmannia glutinosa]|uniref:Uncharacterized protein n=1 Tax=Rehmannia glutinosa TaxID=99300 RepID=A0ABR0UJL3_REHGL